MLPVRCFTCGKVLGNKSDKYHQLLEAGMPIEVIYNELQIQKLCCKRMLLTHVNTEEITCQYDTLPNKVERTTSVDNTRVYRAI